MLFCSGAKIVSNWDWEQLGLPFEGTVWVLVYLLAVSVNRHSVISYTGKLPVELRINKQADNAEWIQSAEYWRKESLL
jgi:hypothetical protein